MKSPCCFTCLRWTGKRKRDKAWCCELFIATEGKDTCILWVKHPNTKNNQNSITPKEDNNEKKLEKLLSKLKIIQEENTAILPNGEIVPRGTIGSIDYNSPKNKNNEE